jgi:7-cyano-7-deazaguanine reductase
MALTHLGKPSVYFQTYTPTLLEAVPRAQSRAVLGINDNDPLPFNGADIWNAYEISWLDEKGKPVVAIGECRVDCGSPYLIESKSFKLYLSSFAQSRFKNIDTVRETISRDLTQVAGTPVHVMLSPLSETQCHLYTSMPGTLLDHLDVHCEPTDDASLLHTHAGPIVRETLTSNVLKSNCPVTGQPDWGSVQIQYTGQRIHHGSLLRYIVHFYYQQAFHEHCVEKMFVDILERCKPSSLTVYARYTRRGGLDINPYRSTESNVFLDNIRLVRQ